MELTLLSFALVVFITAATPGPTVLLALSNGSRFGICRAGFGMLGAAASDIVLITAASVGLGAILATSVFWFTVVKLLGVAYLVWLGIQFLRSTGAIGFEKMAQGKGPRDGRGAPSKLFLRSFLVAVTNPKGYLFVTALLPQFIDPAEPLAAQYAKLAVVFVSVDLAVMAAYAGFGAGAIRFLRQDRVVMLDRLSGGALIFLAGALLLFSGDRDQPIQ